MRLDAEDRTQLTSALKQAARDHASAVLLRVDGDAWAHRTLRDDAVDAAAISAGPHALIRAVETATFSVVVHARGKISELGLALFLAADVRILDRDATLAFDASVPHSLFVAGLPAVIRHLCLPAEDLLWTGRTLNAGEATARGLVSEVGDLDRAEELVARLGSIPATTSALRRALRADRAAGLAERLEYDAWLAVATGSDDE
ncbi:MULTISPECIES: enoyl-CoA hydratase-related protein [unclassified Nocardioides]|uniref:enoyl-CoA hydratase-related protein n=1 Tax=unclassified Nocardioides TaxID=2615069 RepID=UPI00361A51E8